MPAPDYEVESFSDVTPQMLDNLGVAYVLVDVDGTLRYENTDGSTGEFIDKEVKHLRTLSGLACFTVGIATTVFRNEEISELLPEGAPMFFGHYDEEGEGLVTKLSGKIYFSKVLADLAVAAERVVMIGNDEITDIQNPAGLGMRTILVKRKLSSI